MISQEDKIEIYSSRNRRITTLKEVVDSLNLGSGNSPVRSVNSKTGDVVLNAEDVDADQKGSANAVKELLSLDINQVKALAETNQLKLTQKVEIQDFEITQEQVELNRLAILTKADIQALAQLALLVDTKADQSYVNEQIAQLVGSAPEALDTIYELAEALQNNGDLIEGLNQSVANRVRFDVATQALTEIQKQNARTNIGAEKLGEAQQLVSQITAQSLGAATASQGAKADTALQSGDVAPVALTGLFSSLGGQNKIFDVVYSAYLEGVSSVITSSDSLGTMLTKLQAQIKKFQVNWVDVSTIATYNSALDLPRTKIEISKSDGQIHIRGYFRLLSAVGAVALFTINSDSYFVDAPDSSASGVLRLAPIQTWTPDLTTPINLALEQNSVSKVMTLTPRANIGTGATYMMNHIIVGKALNP